MKVKVGDKVKILTGKDKGKEGRVTVTLKKKDRVVVEGVNIAKKLFAKKTLDKLISNDIEFIYNQILEMV